MLKDKSIYFIIMPIETVILYHHINERVIYLNSSVDTLLKLRTGDFSNLDIYSVKRWSPCFEFNIDIHRAYTLLLRNGFKQVSSTLSRGILVEVWSGDL